MIRGEVAVYNSTTVAIWLTKIGTEGRILLTEVAEVKGPVLGLENEGAVEVAPEVVITLAQGKMQIILVGL